MKINPHFGRMGQMKFHTHTRNKISWLKPLLYSLLIWQGSWDVGWGQECNFCLMRGTNFSLNPTLTPNTNASYSLYQGFIDGYVAHWSRYISSPHLFIRDSAQMCLIDEIYRPSVHPTPDNCVAGFWIEDTGYLEGISTPINFINDPFITYDVNINCRLLDCLPENLNRGKMYVRASNDAPLNFDYYVEFEPPIPPGNDFQQIALQFIEGFEEDFNFCFSFKPNKNYSSLQLTTTVDSAMINPSNTNNSTATISYNHVNVTCRTSALTGINTIEDGLTACYSTIKNNSSTSSFVSYFWDFGDGATSTAVGPCHSYAMPGTYRLCVQVVDNNGCCARFCEDKIIDNPPSCTNLTETISVGNNANSTIELSNLLGTTIPFTVVNNIKTVTGQFFHLNGNLIIDEAVKMVDVDWFIESGSQITLQKTLNLDQNMLQSCNNMWKGIIVNNQLLRMRNNCEIRDAEDAIILSNGSKIDLRNNRFINNFRGIYAPGSQQKNITIGASGMTILDNDFIFEASSLKPPYLGQANYSNIARSGVELERVSNFNITGGKFENLLFGVHNTRSRMTINNVDFEDTRELASTGLYILRGGSRNKVTNLCSFKNIFRSIEIVDTDQGVINIENSTFENNRPELIGGGAVFGIRARSSDNNEIYISNTNEFNYKSGLAVQISQCNLKTLKIDDNDFTSSGLNHQAMLLSNLKTGVHIINNNRFYYTPSVTYSKSTVQLGTINYLQCTNNQVFGINAGHAKSFIDINEVRNSVFRHNTISGHPYGFNVNAGQPNGYCCNEVDQAAGDNFRITGLSGSTIVQNTFNTFTFDAQGGSRMGPQVNHGNVWTGNGQQAQILNGDQTKAQTNQIVYDPNQTGGVPLDGSNWNVLPPSLASEWFEEGGTHGTCVTNPACDISSYPPPINPDLSPAPWDSLPPTVEDCERLLFILNRYEITDLNDSFMVWAYHNVYFENYRFLRDWRDRYGDNFVADCLDSIPQTDVALDQWYEADKQQIKVTYMSAAHRAARDGIDGAIDAAQVTLDALAGSDPEGASLTYLAAAASLTLSMDQRQALLDSARTEVVGRATAMMAVIDALPIVFPFLAYRQYVMKMEMKALTVGPENFSVAEWNQLRVIAGKCPHTVGEAVFRAQALMVAHDEYLDVSYAACTPSGFRTTSATPRNDSDIVVHPNPTTGLVTIDRLPLNGVCQVHIKDITGQEVYTCNVSSENANIDLIDQPNGMYMYTIMLDQKTIKVGKLILIK